MSKNKKNITIGVLALQGSYHEHISHLNNLFMHLADDDNYNSKYIFESREIKNINDLNNLNGLIIPGGESTVISILLQRNKLLEPIRKLIQIDKLPCWGTCAGLILLCNKITNTKVDLNGTKIEQSMKYRSIGGLDVEIQRNSFGRQINSFNKNYILKNFYGDLKNKSFNCIFIRAPVIKNILPSRLDNQGEFDGRTGIVYAKKLNENTNRDIPQILLKIYENSSDELIVAVKQENILGTSFHPELVAGNYKMHKWFIDEFVLN